MKQIERKHAPLVRLLHWLNFLAVAVLTWSGLLLYYENDNFRIGIGSFTLFHFFPQGFYNALWLAHRNDEGLAWHFVFMWLFLAVGVVYAGYTLISGHWRHLVPRKGSFGAARRVVLHDLGLRKELPPQAKYNGAQKIAYTGIVLAGALMAGTGLAMYYPRQFGWFGELFGGEGGAKNAHFWLTIIFMVYVVVHVAQVIRAGWGNFRSMVSGEEVVSTAALGGVAPTDPVEPALPRSEPMPDDVARSEARRRSIKGFAALGASLVVLLIGWVWARSTTDSSGIPAFMKPAVEAYKQAESGHEGEGGNRAGKKEEDHREERD